jgi:hypothetical protein
MMFSSSIHLLANEKISFFFVAAMGRGLGSKRGLAEMNQCGYNTQVHGSNARNLPV